MCDKRRETFLSQVLTNVVEQAKRRELQAFQKGRSATWKPKDLASTIQEISLIENAMRSMEARSRKERLLKIERAYEIAYALSNDPDAFLDWCRSFKASDRKRPDYRKPELALHYVLGQVMPSNEPDIRARLSKLRTALALPFEEKVHPSKILDFIAKSGGTDQMIKNERARRKALKGGKTEQSAPSDDVIIRIQADARAKKLLGGRGDDSTCVSRS